MRPSQIADVKKNEIANVNAPAGVLTLLVQEIDDVNAPAVLPVFVLDKQDEETEII